MPRSSTKPQRCPAPVGAPAGDPGGAPADPARVAASPAPDPVRWPVHPGPLAEELRTSWLARVGAAYGLSPPQLCDFAWWSVHPRRGPPGLGADSRSADGGYRARHAKLPDLDGPLRGALLLALAAVSGQPVARITALGHRALAWPLADGRVQWCPRCLAGDPIPYLRQGWRDALTVCCLEHRRVLVDQCAACHAPLALPTSLAMWPAEGGRPNLGDPTARGAPAVAWLTGCVRCGADRRRAGEQTAWPEFTEPTAREWAQLVAFEAVRTRGQHRLPQPSGVPVWIDGRTYLDGLWTLIHCITGPGLASQQRRGGVARWLGLPEFAMLPHGELPAWSVWVRRRMLRVVLAMLEDWPARFLALCQGPLATGNNRFCGPRGRAPPAWLAELGWPEVLRARAAPRRGSAEPCPDLLGWSAVPRTPARREERPWAAQLLTPDEDDDLAFDACGPD